MTIYILNWRDPYHPLAGGAELSLFEHAKFWQKKGANIVWFGSYFSGAKDNEVIDGIEFIRRGSHFTVHLHAYIHFRKKKFSKSDIVVDSFHFLPFFTTLYMRNVKKIALINETARNVWFKNLLFPFSLIGYLSEPSFFLFYKKTIFITGSESARDDLQKFGITTDHIRVIHHGFNKPPLGIKIKKERYPTVLFLSRLTSDKGIEDAIKAVSLLRNEIHHLRFLIGGRAETKEYEEKVKRLIKEEKIDTITSILGHVSEKKKYELFTRSWLLVHPSVREGWGLNVIEANACGTVAVAYTVPGLIDSIQNNKTGVLVGNVDFKNLASGISILIKNTQMRSKFEKNARVWSSNFSWEKAGEKSWKVLMKL